MDRQALWTLYNFKQSQYYKKTTIAEQAASLFAVIWTSSPCAGTIHNYEIRRPE